MKINSSFSLGPSGVSLSTAVASVITTSISDIDISLVVQGLIIPQGNVPEGKIIKALGVPWMLIAQLLKDNSRAAFEIPAHKWEELIAAAFDNEGYDEVILTPRSGDYGRDVIAIKRGLGAVRIIGSVKAYSPGHLVRHDDVRALLGVLNGDPQATKAILTTTSDFAPTIIKDPFIKPCIPYRLELMNGVDLHKWFDKLSRK